ncbi:MAG TPA: heparan-alpha-glucosaminide N-acetyltransferase domain-containing protein [Flavipsychrobacter sp.]|nr:heparan-alpha-glucosaminide N-acetyltransferase domain-containing protein [Flavipsychrobacter sp.]
MSSLTGNTKRVVSVDILRGIVMVIMALDHARDYFSNYKLDPLDLTHTTTALFLTRWITHFCAPVFVFLAGTSAFLSFSKGRTKGEISKLLFTRGIWLIILELTIVRFGWMFNVDYSLVFVQVIWAIGWSMIFLAGLCYLPVSIIAIIGFIIVFGHNALDTIHTNSFGSNGYLWNVIHEQGPIQYGNKDVLFVLYPLIPWIGVMALGYCFGGIVRKPEKERNKWLYTIGFGAIALFIILRWSNVYGDPFPWQRQTTVVKNILAFIKCQKYPPSLLYLLMTLGPAIASMPLLEKMSNGIGSFFTVYGRVPMFYYILHIYLLHSMALITGVIMGFPTSTFTDNGALFSPATNWGFPLAIVYIYWISTVLMLYYPCRWFMQVKQTNKSWWLSYL